MHQVAAERSELVEALQRFDGTEVTSGTRSRGGAAYSGAHPACAVCPTAWLPNCRIFVGCKQRSDCREHYSIPHRLTTHMQDNLGASSNFDDAVAISARLKENMDAEGRCSNECFVEVLAMLSPLQQVRRCPAPGAPVMQSNLLAAWPGPPLV